MPNIKDKVVIITGASSGIGAALGRSFSAQGAKVALAARRSDRLEAVAADCSGDCLTITADLFKETDRNNIIHQTLARWKHIDILVNNAGLGAYGHFLDSTEAEWRKLFEINLFAPMLLTRKVLPIMQVKGKGLIINLASIGGLIAHSDKVAQYVASKHAMVGFSRGLARDLEGTGIKVLAACPHLTDTEFFTVAPGAEEMAPVIKEVKQYLDSPEDVATGILDQLDSDRLIIFPTQKPARAFEKNRDI